MQHKYFAASNSSEGFRNYFPDVFGDVDRLYVIKGGPGTGKSSFMKKCASEAIQKGHHVEYYYCSSDPSSLDGVLIEKEGKHIGILDGTAPHVWEPTHPGVKEEIVNLGQFWNSELLGEQKNEIFALSNKKSAAYKRAYDYLRSCGNLRAVTDSLLRSATDMEKLRGAAERMVRSLDLPVGTLHTKPVILRAVAMTGKHRFDSFEVNADRIFWVGGFYGVGQVILDAVGEALRGKAVTVRLSYDPVDPRHLDGIFIEDNRTAFLLAEGDDYDSDDSGKTVNPKRFIRAERLRRVRGELRYATRLYQDCLDGALHALSEAKVYHFLLEDIYKNAMDFAALTEFTKRFVGGLIQ
ncbi:MAG: hypothetical protein IJY39_07980 [Clostridia bacterium]|nr:hypothetical protein [Clostridia bacterium]